MAIDTTTPQLKSLYNEWEYAFSRPPGPDDDSLNTLSDEAIQTGEVILNWYCAGYRPIKAAVRNFAFCVAYNLYRRERQRRGLPPP